MECLYVTLILGALINPSIFKAAVDIGLIPWNCHF